MSKDAYSSASMEHNVDKKEYNNNEPSEVDQQVSVEKKLHSLKSYKFKVEGLDFQNLTEDDLCFLYKNHLNDKEIKNKIESLTAFIETCGSDNPHPKVSTSWGSELEQLKKDILFSIDKDEGLLSVGDAGIIFDPEVLVIHKSAQEIQARIDKNYPGIQVSIDPQFMDSYGEVYSSFKKRLKDAYISDVRSVSQKLGNEAFEKEMKKFLTLSDETKVLVLYLFDTGVNMDQLSKEEGGYLAGCLTLLFFNTTIYEKYVRGCDANNMIEKECNIDIRKKSLDGMADDIISYVSPKLWRNMTFNFRSGYLRKLDEKVKTLNTKISVPAIRDMQEMVRQKILRAQRANINSKKVDTLL